MANVKVSAVDIKKLYYFDPSAINDLEDIDFTALKTLLSSATEVKNVHQDTWTLEESESSQDEYKNQLTGMTYRMGAKSMGAITANFTIGQYEYTDKKNLLGGEVIKKVSDVVGWKRARGIVEIKMGIIALTQDEQYCVLPYCNLNAHEANTDKAIGLAVVATAMEPLNDKIAPEYWLDNEDKNNIITA